MSIIYCYENKTNGKKYIGQTNNERRRYVEHRANHLNEKSDEYNSLIHIKMREYGFENFKYYIIEENISAEDINNREVYWIEKLQSFVEYGRGYNLTKGGNQHFKPKDVEKIRRISEKLMNRVEYSEIEESENCSKSYISDINSGKSIRFKEYSYPIRTYYKSQEDYSELIKDLKESTDSFKKLSEKHNISEAMIKKINYGKIRTELSTIYPIRKKSGVKQKSDKVKQMLLNNKTQKEIIDEVKVSRETVRRINLGITHFDKNLKYPLKNL